MRNFLKILLACFLAVLLFFILLMVSGVSLFNSALEEDKPEIKPRTVLVIDLSKPMMDQRLESGFALPEGKTPDILGLFDAVRAIEYAATDTLVKGIYLLTRTNALGYAATTELTDALKAFKRSGKFLVAAGDYIGQRGYEIAMVADEIYCNPMGMVDWSGYGMEMLFFKNALDKLDVKPEIFYAGQFKSATEPFRMEKMSEANRLQLTTFLEDHYTGFLTEMTALRGGDTAEWRSDAKRMAIRNGQQALAKGMLTGLLHDDEIRARIGKKIGEKAIDKIPFMSLADYIQAGTWRKGKGSDKIAVIYAEGEIVDGEGSDGEVGGQKFRGLLRKARLDERVKAVVLRVNSPGGSVLASEAIKHEVELTTRVKPLVVSMGNYAASGGYYISCDADSIFAQPNTLTGSIGVFGMFFDASGLMKDKLGITADEVTTAPSATMGSVFRPLSALEREYLQADIDSVYMAFKQRVAKGRGLSMDSVESLAQGRIWSGKRAVALGLADRLGGMKEALDCAARMAKLKEYTIREYPEVKNIWQKLMGGESDNEMASRVVLQNPAGAAYVKFWKYYHRLSSWSGVTQMRLPFFLEMH